MLQTYLLVMAQTRGHVYVGFMTCCKPSLHLFCEYLKTAMYQVCYVLQTLVLQTCPGLCVYFVNFISVSMDNICQHLFAILI